MEIKEIVISRSCRINIGNYEGLEHFLSMKAQLDELDDEVMAVEELAAKVERAMVAQLVRSYKARGKKDMTDPAKVAKHHGLSYVPVKKS